MQLKNFEMPDGSVIYLNYELYRSSEILFQPNLVGINSKGSHFLAYDCIQSAVEDARKVLYENIVLFGGNTLISGFS